MNKILNNLNFHFTLATILAIVGAIIALAAAFGLDLSPQQQQAILTLVGLLGGGVVVGGGIKSAGMFMGGVHPAQLHAQQAAMAAMQEGMQKPMGAKVAGPPPGAGPRSTHRTPREHGTPPK